MAPPTKKPSKPIFKIASPFTETKWPLLSHEDQEVITELLCNLLAPLGDHRRAHSQPSKGRKRKRDTKFSSDEVLPLPIPPPAIGSHLLIGLNSVTRHLETLAAITALPTVPVKEPTVEEQNIVISEGGTEQQSRTSIRPLSLIVLTHPQPSLSPPHAHVPTLVHLAALQSDLNSNPGDSARLVALPTSNDARFASALHIPRVGAIGIFEGAPGAKGLEDYVRRHVGLTECAWIDEAIVPEWRGLNVQQT